MKLRPLLAFAMKNRAVELHLAVNRPAELHLGGEVRPVNVPPLMAKDFEEMVVQNLGALARESLRTTGRCEESIVVEGLGKFRAFVEAEKARIVLPVISSSEGSSQSLKSDRGPGAVPTFSERLRGLFGGKR